MLSHDNITWTCRIAMEHYQWQQERLLSYLPLSHVAACNIDCYMSMSTGCEVHFADDQALKGTLVGTFKLLKFSIDSTNFVQVENLKRVRPTQFLGVPRVWEKIAEKMQEVGKSSKGLKKLIANWAKAQSTRHHTMIREGKMKPEDRDIAYTLAQKIVFR